MNGGYLNLVIVVNCVLCLAKISTTGIRHGVYGCFLAGETFKWLISLLIIALGQCPAVPRICPADFWWTHARIPLRKKCASLALLDIQGPGCTHHQPESTNSFQVPCLGKWGQLVTRSLR